MAQLRMETQILIESRNSSIDTYSSRGQQNNKDDDVDNKQRPCWLGMLMVRLRIWDTNTGGITGQFYGLLVAVPVRHGHPVVPVVCDALVLVFQPVWCIRRIKYSCMINARISADVFSHF
jgi:hypothetical protein